MSEGRILLFVSPDCPNCHEVISGMVESKIIGENIAKAIPVLPQFIARHEKPLLEIFDSGTVDGLAASAFHNVRSVPTLVFIKNGDVLKRIDGDHKEIAETIAKWARGEKKL